METCFDGASGIVMRASVDPEVILLDIGLPHMDGYEVAQRLRAAETGRHATLIALTGYGLPVGRSGSAAEGFDHHVTEPIDPEDVVRLLAAPN